MSAGFLRTIKPVGISIAGIAVVFGSLYAWRSMRAGPVEPGTIAPLPVATVQARPRSVAAELQAIGSLQAVQAVLLAPDTAGRVVGIFFEAGQQVEQGSVLVQLHDAPERAERDAASATADFARLQLKRSQQLQNTGAESRERLEQRVSAYRQAVAAVRQLDARIQQKKIRAPFAGQIGIRRINPGQYLDAGDSIATLTQLDPLYVNFTVAQQELPKLQPGTPVQVSVDVTPGRVFSARISSIEPRINEETRNVLVQALLPNADHALQPGMYVTARLQLAATAATIVLPLTAIQTSAYGDSVMVVRDADAEGIGTAVTVPVTTGRRIGAEVVVTHGVKPGDTVVSAGQGRLTPGAAVRITATAPAAGSVTTR